MGIFTDLFSTDAADKAAKDKIAYAQQGQTQGNSALDTGLATANPLYDKAYQPFSQLYTQAQPGMSAYADASGANGTEGLGRANTNFTSSTGYSGGLHTGIDQVMRTAAARGDLGGGNTSADEIKFASDYDSQKYGNYLAGLAPWLSAGNSAAAGGAGVLTSQAGANLGVAGQKAGIATQTANTEGDAQAQADMAPYQASQNFWGALTGAAGMGLKASGIGGFGVPSLSLSSSSQPMYGNFGQLSPNSPMNGG